MGRFVIIQNPLNVNMIDLCESFKLNVSMGGFVIIQNSLKVIMIDLCESFKFL